MKPRSVIICTPTAGSVSDHHRGALLDVYAHEVAKGDGCLLSTVPRTERGPYISRNRNTIARRFMLETDVPWLLMVDDDVEPPPDICERMLGAAEAYGAQVVAADVGLGGVGTTGFFDTGKRGRFRPATSTGDAPVVWVDYACTTCMLIHRDVLTSVAELFGFNSWFCMTPFRDDHGWWQELGEDFSFSERVRDSGHRLLLLCFQGIGHYKVRRITAAREADQ